MKRPRINVLHVDDSFEAIYLMQNAFEEVDFEHSIFVAQNGYEALNYLKTSDVYDNETIPDLILLDINMPVMDGFEFLDNIKMEEKTKHIPVIMFTTSSSTTDVMKSYQKHANSYIVKPGNLDEYMDVANSIKSFWTHTASLPKGEML